MSVYCYLLNSHGDGFETVTTSSSASTFAGASSVVSQHLGKPDRMSKEKQKFFRHSAFNSDRIAQMSSTRGQCPSRQGDTLLSDDSDGDLTNDNDVSSLLDEDDDGECSTTSSNSTSSEEESSDTTSSDDGSSNTSSSEDKDDDDHHSVHSKYVMQQRNSPPRHATGKNQRFRALDERVQCKKPARKQCNAIGKCSGSNNSNGSSHRKRTAVTSSRETNTTWGFAAEAKKNFDIFQHASSARNERVFGNFDGVDRESLVKVGNPKDDGHYSRQPVGETKHTNNHHDFKSAYQRNRNAKNVVVETMHSAHSSKTDYQKFSNAEKCANDRSGKGVGGRIGKVAEHSLPQNSDSASSSSSSTSVASSQPHHKHKSNVKMPANIGSMRCTSDNSDEHTNDSHNQNTNQDSDIGVTGTQKYDSNRNRRTKTPRRIALMSLPLDLRNARYQSSSDDEMPYMTTSRNSNRIKSIIDRNAASPNARHSQFNIIRDRGNSNISTTSSTINTTTTTTTTISATSTTTTITTSTSNSKSNQSVDRQLLFGLTNNNSQSLDFASLRETSGCLNSIAMSSNYPMLSSLSPHMPPYNKNQSMGKENKTKTLAQLYFSKKKKKMQKSQIYSKHGRK